MQVDHAPRKHRHPSGVFLTSVRRATRVASLFVLLVSATARSQVKQDADDADDASGQESHPAITLDECLSRFEIDRRLTLCDVWMTDGDAIAGFVEMPEYKAVLERATRKDASRVTVVPENSKTTKRFGVVKVEHAILRDLPSDKPGDRDNLSDLVLGEPIWILDQAKNGAYIVHSSDGYVGWVDQDSIEPIDAATMKLKLNQHRTAYADLRLKQVIDTASQKIGTPYLWGGRTKQGIDCSGLVQTSFESEGILLPRDADQQANAGRLVATRWFRDALLPGDLLFFTGQRRGNIHHVAIYLGKGKYIEAAGKDVHISSLNPSDLDYDESRDKSFAWARRVIQ